MLRPCLGLGFYALPHLKPSTDKPDCHRLQPQRQPVILVSDPIAVSTCQTRRAPTAGLEKAGSDLQSPGEWDFEDYQSSSRGDLGHPSCLPLVCVGGDRTLVVRAVLAGIQHRDARPHHPLKPSFHPGRGQGTEMGSSAQDPGPLPQEFIQESPRGTDVGTRTTQKAVQFHRISSGLLKAGPQSGSKEESTAPIPHPHQTGFKQGNRQESAPQVQPCT